VTPRVHAALEAALRAGLDDPALRLAAIHPLGGGCISHAARLETSAGAFFAKWNDDAPADLFEREADGLRALARADSGLAVPRVVWAGAPSPGVPALLVTEYLAPRRPRTGDDETLGRGLAAIHRLSAPSFGFPVASYCGSTRQDNAPAASWAEFYARRRLAPLVHALERERGLPAGERRAYERVIERLPSLVAEGAPPALIHGDLWSGNVMTTERGPALIDPACAYADREMEFGITTLFGGFSRAFWSAYEEAWPLPAGWRERNALYQLYHLLNHHLLFGGHYGGQALEAARRYA
jgi:fructosamine-3-kinase